MSLIECKLPLSTNIDQSKAHADARDRPHQTRTISYSFTCLSNGAWLVSNTHSSWLINISSSTKREENDDGPVDVCKSSNKKTRTWISLKRKFLAQKTKDNFGLSAQHAH